MCVRSRTREKKKELEVECEVFPTLEPRRGDDVSVRPPQPFVRTWRHFSHLHGGANSPKRHMKERHSDKADRCEWLTMFEDIFSAQDG